MDVRLSAGQCGRCGAEGPTVPSSRIVSERFTGFDAWPFGSRRLCTPCAWAYSHAPTAQPILLITADAATEFSQANELADLLARGALAFTHAVCLPVAKRRHVLPTTEWGNLATDALSIPWDATCASLLADLIWLRTHLGATWPQLQLSAPPAALLTAHSASDWPRIIDAWGRLPQWRTIPALWAAARALSSPPSSP